MSDLICHVKKTMRAILVFAGACVVAFSLAGCDLSHNYTQTDREASMNFQDYRDSLAPRPMPDEMRVAEKTPDSSIPSLQPYIAGPSEELEPMPLVSIAVNQTVPLRDALYELANQAGYDIELDPNITGSIIFTAREKPFDVVIGRIAEIANLRYTLENGVLRIQEDRPYSKTYQINYLNYIRQNESTINTSIAVVSSSDTDVGSGFNVESSSESNFWAELQSSLEQILGVRMGSTALRTEATPQITAVAAPGANVQPVVTPTGEEGAVQVQPPEAVLQVQALPVDDTAGRDQDEEELEPSFSLNRQAGLVSVFASERAHKRVEEFLTLLKRSVTSQVLIEAKVLEVSLSDEYATGVDWNDFALTGQIGVDINLPQQPFFGADQVGGSGITLDVGGNNVGAIIQALSQFGTVKALASPRLTVLNNQSAVLNVARNLVYFELEIDITQDENTFQTNVDSTIQNVPEGVLINVQPSINLEERKISMAIRPTITSVEEFVEDPAIPIAIASFGNDDLPDEVTAAQSLIPQVDIQEFDSVIEVNSGEAIVMGGLMQDRVNTTEQGVPVLSEIPLLGTIFRSHTDRVSKTELILFLKATIVDREPTIHRTDRELYKWFSGDRRPFDL